jgi:signal transduction histidine kinase
LSEQLSTSQLHFLIEQLPLATALVEASADGATVFRLPNAAFRELFATRATALNNRPLGEVFGDNDARAIGALLRTDVQRMSLEFDTDLNCNGSAETTRCTVHARSIFDGQAKFVLVTGQPAVPLAPSDPALLREVGEHQREDFIATLTHDLKTPIVGANMVLTALLDGSVGTLEPAQSEIIGKLRTSNQALLKMIQNLLEVYKYESGTESLRFDGANLSDIVNFCVDDVRPLMESKRIGLEVFCAKSEMLLICDEYAIKRVLINLLGNAVKFTPEGGTISIRAFEDAHLARVMVKDTGRGISAMDRQKLFQRFWQGEPGRRYAAGTGLGLYFCYNVVKAHGGKIICDSEIGRGTTFTVELPKHVYAT